MIRKPHVGHMEVAVAERQNIIVPNVSWGLSLRHEADLLVLHNSGRFTEVEIKVTKSDLIADFDKPHGHSHEIIGRLIYAVLDYLKEIALEILPKHVGLIVVSWCSYKNKFKAKWVRIVKFRDRKKPDQKIIQKFLELGCMRIWTLKSALLECKQSRLKYETN